MTEVFKNVGAAYLETGPGASIPSPLNIGIENSRRFRALPVYASLHAYGRDGYIDMIRRQRALAVQVATYFDSHPAYRLLPSEISINEVVRNTFIVVMFQAKDDKLNGTLVSTVNKTSKIYVSGTSWNGKKAARIAVSNWQVDLDRDIKIIKEVFDGIAESI
jgi:glutamate/tyrosine decarboxylase-like PLP-dependent enzyme